MAALELRKPSLELLPGFVDALQQGWSRDLEYVELTTDLDNVPSQKVITNNGGALVDHFEMPRAYGEGLKARYRIPL